MPPIFSQCKYLHFMLDTVNCVSSVYFISITISNSNGIWGCQDPGIKDFIKTEQIPNWGTSSQIPLKTTTYWLFLCWIAVSWLLCGLIGSLSMVFTDADHVTAEYDDGVAPSCVITSGYYQSNYVATVTGCILVTIFGIWLYQVCFDKALRFHTIWLHKYMLTVSLLDLFTHRELLVSSSTDSWTEPQNSTSEWWRLTTAWRNEKPPLDS